MMHWQNIFRLSPEEGAHIADVADNVVSGGGGLVRQLFRAKRELLAGVSQLVDAQIREMDDIDEVIRNKDRPRWKGSIGRGLLTYPARRALSIRQELARAEASFLRGLADSIEQTAEGLPRPTQATNGKPGGPEKIEIE